MTPTPPSSSDESALPPRHRPTLGNLAKDTTETDLWAFEENSDALGETNEPLPVETTKPANRIIPVPRDRLVGGVPREVKDRPVPKIPTSGEDRIRMNVSKIRLKESHEGATPTVQSKPESDFDDLDDWEDDKLDTETVVASSGATVEPLAPMVFAQAVTENKGPAKFESAPTPPFVDRPSSKLDEFSPVPREGSRPISLIPHLGLSKTERFGLILLIALLLVGAASILMFALNRLPTDSMGKHEIHYPIKGSHLSVISASTYWRPPITDGPAPDTVRRDTRLLPVLEVEVSGGPAALRVLFRNDEGTVVGDAVTRAVQTGGVLKIPATAGFDDLAMNSVYRTGEATLWTIEVYEAPSQETAGKDFKKLFEMNISTDRR